LLPSSSTQSFEAAPEPGSARLDDPLLLREWFLAAWSGEIAPGHTLARRVLGRDLVIWRSSKGLHCWLDLCVHRGAKLSLGTVRAGTDCLVCPYHAWEYAPTGQCVRIPAQPGLVPPAKARAQVFHARERYGAVWVCLGEPAGDPPEFAAAEEPGFRSVPAGPYRFRALGPRVIENFLDVAHLGFVHAGLLGDPKKLEIEEYEVAEGPRGPEAAQIRIWQPNPDGTGKGALVNYRYWVEGPLTAAFEKTTSEGRFAILAQITPVDREHCEMRMLMSMNYGHEVPEDELRAFQDKVAEQDRAVVESQRPELLPLDLQAELHLRSDRMAIAYRKWLRKIGLRYGAA
jgi:phenylpropionate dioxygenase-like ring-hydroxylating dioxygenase large terminal subunit